MRLRVDAAGPRRRGEAAAAPGAVARDLRIVRRFLELFCERRHGRPAADGLCDSCAELLEYARGKRERCPLDPKPTCRKCPAHCYDPEHRRRIREVMRFSGIHFVKRGRLDWLLRYFLS